MDVAAAGHRAARERLLDLAAVADVRRGPGYVAVRTGLPSNDLNGVVAEAGYVPTADLVADLTGWFGPAPAQWLAAAPDPDLTERLVQAGLVPERTGWWCGRPLTAADRQERGAGVAGVEGVAGVDRIEDAGSLAKWVEVAGACGWGERPAYDLSRRPHWLGRRDGRPVGVASAWRGEECELVDVAVLPDARRAGVGSTLVRTVIAWAAATGAGSIVAAPSPDGWDLLRTHGFRAERVTACVAFYWG